MTTQQSTSGNDWTSLHYLLGKWIGEGGGEPGQGTGYFSFSEDLQGNILVRKNHADYPATQESHAYSHDDLMIIYKDPATNQLRAIYFDNERHVINYTVEELEAGNTIQFVSEASPSSPGFRFTYFRISSDTLKLKFEIAPPGQSSAFSTYIEARAHRE